jgi:hypothetical protein
MLRWKEDGVRLFLILTALIAMLAGCSASSNAPQQSEKEDVERGVEQTPDGEKIQKEVSVPAKVPTYTLTRDEAGMVQGFDVRNIAASTEAASEEDLEAITRELWAESVDVDSLQVLFYPNEPGADITGTGMAFLSEAAARTVISSMYAASANADIEGQVEEAMSNDGIYVIPVEAMIDEIIEEECASWDTTTLGTPPPEWDCPGY